MISLRKDELEEFGFSLFCQRANRAVLEVFKDMEESGQEIGHISVMQGTDYIDRGEDEHFYNMALVIEIRTYPKRTPSNTNVRRK